MVEVDKVTDLLREAAERAILPRYRRLERHEIAEKTPGEVVTAADGEAEAILSLSLPGLLPGSRVVGEEGCAAEPGLLRDLGQGLVWLLDPLDGTANFAAGKPPFAIMLALLRDGLPLVSWMLDPLSGELWAAEAGGGAWRGDQRLRTDQRVPDAAEMRGALTSHFMSAAMQDRIRGSLSAVMPLPKLMCSGAEYPAIALGERQLSLFWRTLPWDHVPGALFLAEAGGHVCRLDGAPYRAISNRDGLIVAHNRGIAEVVLDALRDRCAEGESQLTEGNWT